MKHIILIVIIIALIYLLYYFSEGFVAPTYEIWKKTKDPLWFEYYGDDRTLPRGYSEKDMFLADIIVKDSWYPDEVK